MNKASRIALFCRHSTPPCSSRARGVGSRQGSTPQRPCLVASRRSRPLVASNRGLACRAPSAGRRASHAGYLLHHHQQQRPTPICAMATDLSASSAGRVQAHLDLPYAGSATGASPRQQLDLFEWTSGDGQPATEPTQRPLLIYIHGGLWVDRDKSAYRALGAHWCRTLGAHVAVVNYRQSRAGGGGLPAPNGEHHQQPILHPTHTADVLAALIWLVQGGKNGAGGVVSSFASAAPTDVFLVGHSCGGHIAGLLMLAEPASGGASCGLNLSPIAMAALSRVRGAVGIEGIFDCARFAADFPDWSGGIVDAFAEKRENWDSPQDLLPPPSNGAQQIVSLSREKIQRALATATAAGQQRRAAVPWLVIHSPEDPWVNLPQAELFHAALLAAAAQRSGSSPSGAVVPPAAAALPASKLCLVQGAHFEVVDRIGGPKDEVTPLLKDFVQRLLSGAGQ